MSQQLSGESFLSVVGKSGLVEPPRLTRLVEDFAAAGGDRSDAPSLAEELVDKQVITRWQSEKLLQGKHKGYFLGKYRLLALLGRGGMSSVYLADHVLMRRRCAIKVLPAKRVGDTSYLARFHREAQAVASLDDPNIVRAYDVDHQMDRDAEIHFLVMEYVDGCSLQELVARQGVVGFTDAVDYMRQAALGLAHAHKAGLVHRDIKPGNLLLDKQGTVKILDLGLARFFNGNDDEQALTIQHDEKVLGTADYLAPEQALDSHSVDARADIYALGCTLYFLLTGKPPFTEGTLAQRLMAHQSKEPPGVELARPDTPASLVEILRKMMAKKREDRYQSAAETAHALLLWLDRHAEANWRKEHSSIFSGLPESTPRRAAPVAARVVSPIARPTAAAAPQEPVPVVEAAPPAVAEEAAPSAAEPELAAFFAGLGSGAATVPPKPSPTGKSSIHTPAPSSLLKTAGADAESRSSKKLGLSSRKISGANASVATPVTAIHPPEELVTVQPPAAEMPPAAESIEEVAAPPVPSGPDFSFLMGLTDAPIAEEPPALDQEALPNVFDFSNAPVPAKPELVAEDDIEPVVKPAAVMEPEVVSEEYSEEYVEPMLEPEPVIAPPIGPPMALPAAEDAPTFPDAGLVITPVVASRASRATVKSKSVAAKKVTAPAAAGRKGGRGVPKSWLIGGGGAATVVLVGIVGSLLGWFSSAPAKKSTAKKPSSTAAATATATKTPTSTAPTVSTQSPPAAAAWTNKREATVGPSGEFPTISAALQQVQRNFQPRNRSDRFVVKVAAGIYADRISIVGKEWKDSGNGTNVIIQGEGVVTLNPSGADPVLRLNNVTGVQLRNLSIQAGGKPIAIELAESLDRCQLQNLRVEGFGDAGIFLSGALGSSFSSEQLLLESIHVRGSGNAVGVRATKGTQSDSVDCQNILFRRCRFVGPFAAGVSLKGTEVRGWEFRECIFAQATVGVEFLDAAPWSNFLFLNNTFYQCPTGVRFEKQPPTSSKGLSFQRNLFLGVTKGEVLIESGFSEPTLIASQMLGEMQGNWSDRPAPATPGMGELEMWGAGQRGQQGLEFVSTDPAHDKFLAPVPSSPVAAVGGQATGNPAWIGAMGP